MRTINVLTARGFRVLMEYHLFRFKTFSKNIFWVRILIYFYSNLNKKIENCEVLLVECHSLKQDGKIKLMRYCNFSKSGKKEN